ncbi:transient receptor potential cation channel protein painless-like [Chironomus tepperi]|uniref:transient receptor potential cation channel protein painless-like n=1 Tax=Chironomus tepperi TaxID=113505 RepID=UPI00391F7AF9
MMLKNSLICQYFDDEDSLIGFQLKLINGYDFWINLKNLLYYFEEASQYGQINNSSALSNLVQQSILYSKDDGALKKQLFLGLAMIYTSKSDNNLLESRLNDIPFFKLLTLILNERESDFIESFPKEYIKMEQNVKEMAAATKGIDPATTQSFYEDCLTHLSFVLLYAAMKTNQTKIMIKIFEFNNFSNIKIEFPDNMAVKEVIKDLTILKFLEKKYEIIKTIFPASWITPKILEKFLDSRITSENGTYKVDCQFMHPFSKDTKIESNDVIEYILNDYELKPLVTHPVIEVILRTKLTANSFMFFWNFIIFMLSYVAPTMLLAFEYHSDNKSLNCTEIIDLDMDYRCSNGQGLNYFMIYALIAIRLPYIIGREYLQYLVFYERDYFNIMSNYFECGLIVASIIQIMLTFVYQCSMLYNLFILLSIVEAINVFLMTIAIGYLFPFLNFPIYMICFKKILFTYLNIFVVFLPLFIGSATLIFIIFDKNFGGKIEDFYDLGNAFMKYIIMFSGEMGIDPKELNGFMQGAVITLVIIFIINQSNLILSIVVNDIQGVMDESKKSNLVFIGWRYVELVRNEAKFGTILNDPKTKSIGHKLIKACFKIVKYFRSRLDYGYQLKYIYIEKETDDVHAVFNKFTTDNEVLRSQHITERQNNVFMRKVIGWWKQLSGNYIVNEEIKDKVEKIVMRLD